MSNRSNKPSPSCARWRDLKVFFSNHSLRATAATRLYMAGVDEQLIAEKSGHRSVSVRNYKRTSEDQEKRVSDIVQGQKLGSPPTKKPRNSDQPSVSLTCKCPEVSVCVQKDEHVTINVKFNSECSYIYCAYAHGEFMCFS